MKTQVQIRVGQTEIVQIHGQSVALNFLRSGTHSHGDQAPACIATIEIDDAPEAESETSGKE